MKIGQPDIAALRAGDQQASRALVAAYGQQVYNTCLGFVQQAQDAEDLTQEVFAEVFERLADFREEASLSTWIYRIAVNASLGFLRKKKAKKRFAFMSSLFDSNKGETLDIPDAVHPGVLAENRERAQVLFAAIAKLPEQQQAAFTLHKVEGLPYQEVADVLETSLSAVESLMHRAHKNLRKLLRDYYEQDKD